MKKEKQTLASGQRRRVLSGNAVTLLMIAAIFAFVAVTIYTGTASRQMTSMVISIACYMII